MAITIGTSGYSGYTVHASENYVQQKINGKNVATYVIGDDNKLHKIVCVESTDGKFVLAVSQEGTEPGSV